MTSFISVWGSSLVESFHEFVLLFGFTAGWVLPTAVAEAQRVCPYRLPLGVAGGLVLPETKPLFQGSGVSSCSSPGGARGWDAQQTLSYLLLL